MNLIIKKDHRGIKAGQVIPIHIGKLNTWVGSNGTGKSNATELLYTALEKVQPKLKKKCYWRNTTIHTDIASLEDYPTFSHVNISSDKLRQAQFIDIDATLDLGIHRLKASEGQNSVQDMLEFFSNSTPETLTIFDETEGHLDYFHKVLFFNNVLPRVKGTVILISHDPTFLSNLSVFDFTDFTEKTGKDYYILMENKFETYKKNMEERNAIQLKKRMEELTKKFDELETKKKSK